VEIITPAIPILLAQQGGFPLQSILMIWVPIGFLFWFLLIRPQQQERKRREAMLAAMKKNDRVVTVGGIYGVITNVHREADEVTIKVDESANVKLRVTVGSIARVLIDHGSSDASSK
jgi:preprotein translocase subunit YajC